MEGGPSATCVAAFVECKTRGNLALSSGHAATRRETPAVGMQVADLLSFSYWR
jgi:hypothetical protein